MTHQSTIESFVAERRLRPICDACVGDYLGLRPEQVAAAANRMARQHALRRFEGRCSGCCTTRIVVEAPLP
ncbi:hypothetical protein [Sphingosinicella sp. BN140058]|uniref:hypothetical protein n=1 Tax=Sphingosinicella sp. BN140058 TaxID=1892855 RepID=UPI001012561C|nr:hypothetical protein [Sphingosinicella sp. BN140058]QAY78577.1 hypothetical protein ETR14_20055 [Sphingosinicella sp. BN140058]